MLETDPPDSPMRTACLCLLALTLTVPALAQGAPARPEAPGSEVRGPGCSEEPVGIAVLDVRGREVRVRATGGFQTDGAAFHVEALCAGSALDIEFESGGVTHQLSYRPAPWGGITRRYTVGLRNRLWGPGAERVEATLLPEVVAHLESRR